MLLRHEGQITEVLLKKEAATLVRLACHSLTKLGGYSVRAEVL